jgi:hypothetical protein
MSLLKWLIVNVKAVSNSEKSCLREVTADEVMEI